MKKQTIYVDDELLKFTDLSLCCTKNFDNKFYTNNYSLIDNKEYFEADFKSIKDHEQKFKQQLEDEKKMHELAKAFYNEKQAEFDKLLYDYNKLQQQLAEKDKEIERLKDANCYIHDLHNNLYQEYQKMKEISNKE